MTLPHGRHWRCWSRLIDDYVHSQQEEVAARSFAADALVELAWYDRAAAHLEAAYGSGRAGYYVHYQRAVLALLQEDGPAYRRACRAAMAAVPAGGAEPEPNGWAFTAYLCSLAPGGLDDYEPAVQLARRALAQHPGSGHCRFVLGVALFRAGQYDEARTNLAACLETNEDPQASHAFSPWVLAMAEQRLGHPDPAQRWHARGCAVAKTAPYYNWRYQTIARALWAESRRAVHGAD
jgi:tetratricopeptide (TPR) repeat protein